VSSGIFEKLGSLVDRLIGGDIDEPEEKSQAAQGAELVCQLWCEQPEEWKNVGGYPVHYKHEVTGLIVTNSTVLDEYNGWFNGQNIALSARQQSKMKSARAAYNRGVKNKLMDKAAVELAEAILKAKDEL
jgi:hypothetical protein